ncbi:MAG: TonB-dependent receptor plug domain-containing protein, partial [bacterium]
RGKASGGNLLGRWSRTISADSDMSLQLYYDRTHLRDPISNQFGPTSILTDDLDTYDLDFQHRFRLGGANHVVWGLGYRYTHDVVGEAPILAFLPPKLDRHLYSAFVQDEIDLRKDVRLTLGTKLEHNDYTGFEVEPSGRLQWNLGETRTLWSAVSRAVRTPSRVDRDIAEPNPPPVVILGKSTFISETVIAYELGYRAGIGKNLSGSVSLFYNDYDHVRSLSFTPNTIVPLFFANNLEGHTRGLELTANYQALAWWRLHVGYDLLKENLHAKPGTLDLDNALNETADPQQQFSLRSSVDLPLGATLDARLRWVDTLHNNNGATVGTVPSYFELDARLGWRPAKGLELSVVGQNLLHDHHPEYGFPGPERVEISRNATGKVTWRF